MSGFQEFLGGLLIVVVILFVFWPYFSLTYLKDIDEDLRNIHHALVEMNKKEKY